LSNSIESNHTESITMPKMNNNDRQNLRFLMEADQYTLSVWYNNCSIDDIAYAAQLLKCAKQEQDLKKTLLTDPEFDSTLEANLILNKFRLA